MFSNINTKALVYAILAVIFTVFLVYLGSRSLQNFDAALVAYLFGTIFAIFGIVYRYSVWIQRPPTKMYRKQTLQMLFSKFFLLNILFSIKEFINNIVLQKFIFKRGQKRGVAHLCMAAGCTMAFMITIPLTFGWIHFSLEPSSGLNPGEPDIYVAHFFGYEMMTFPVKSFAGAMTFGALNWCAILVIIGASYFLRRRLITPGMISTQTFDGDILPLLLLIIVSITGLGLSMDYMFMKGMAYDFMAVTHAVSVIIFLIWLPFGKFFHIIQRPAQVGAHIYKKVGEIKGMQKCVETDEAYATTIHIQDLKIVTKEVGFDFDLGNGKSLLDYSPEGKRDLLAKAHLRARQESGKYFG